MTELELYQIIVHEKIEWHWANNEGIMDVLLMPKFSALDALNKLLVKRKYKFGNGVVCKMKEGEIWLWMQPICDYYGIKIDNVFIHGA